MIDWNKRTGRKSNSTSDYIREMESAVDDLCERLSKDSKDFNSKLFFDALHEYISKDDRLLYTNITNYIFSLEKEEIFGIMQTNLDNVINYIYGEKFNSDHEWKPEYRHQRNPYDRTKRTVLKMWDHMNLAKRQYSLFKMKDDDYAKIVDEKMEEAGHELSKEMNGQLISLVSIFTALSFLLFGGISSLDNIFLGAKDIPVTKLMIVGIIWCFCIMNLVFVFMFFIAKMTRSNIKSTQDVNANLVQKYPLIWWCNLVIVSILLLSCWAYYIKNEGFSVEAYNCLSQHPTLYFIAGTVLIVGLVVGCAVKIYKLSKIELKD
ncbi:hypothetical protein [Lacrimispora sp. 210928-DFI.3.58]|uniref:hypothetical protein n=1 Tax=Lacrimispora sp. 210928-DFI.3.58 TaxID=2883214 RepID=UPI001D0757C7|nr:hypothetical protein [Lacrimispora sp. 210928-DFI.3.58]MCB7321278.1 hypothetical protein [Lacrimispora sp. 210928-DFI.3.58]